MKKLFALVMLFLLAKVVSGQQIFDKLYYNPTVEYATDIVFNNADSCSYALAYNNAHTDVIKIDFYGNLIWGKNYSRNSLYSINQSIIIDTNFVYLAGMTKDTTNTNPGGNLFDISLLKLNANDGSIIHSHAIGSDTLIEDLSCIIKTKDNNFIGVGSANNQESTYGTRDALIIKFDPNLNIIWTKTYKGTFQIRFNGVVESDDGFLYLVGSNNADPQFYSHGLVAKADTTGNLIWSKIIDQGFYEYFNSVFIVNNNLFIGGVSSDDFNATYFGSCIAQMDTAGNLNWFKKYLAGVPSTYGRLYMMNDNKYILLGGYDLITIDSLGIVLNAKLNYSSVVTLTTFNKNSFIGCNLFQGGFRVVKSDSLLTTCSNKNITIIDSLFTTLLAIDTILIPTSNSLVIKNGYTAIAKTFVDSTLCLTSTAIDLFNINSEEKVTIAPNPVNDFLVIKIPEALNYSNKFYWIAIVNVSGQKVFCKKSILNKEGLKIDVSKFPAGIYVINIPELNSFNLKFIKCD